MDTTKYDTEPIRHLSLCAGYGGIDLGLQRVLPDCSTVTYVEIETFAIWNLVKKMETGVLHPAPIWTDLKTMPLGQLREILGRNSLISGGFPCQPFSSAGQHKGDEDPRHLFPYIKDAIRVIQPRWVFLENVEGIISSKLKGDNWTDPAGTPVLLHVLRELERLGYRATAGVFSASEVGLPHQRKRVFILAYRNCVRGEIQNRGELTTEQVTEWNGKERGIEWTPARPGQQQYWWEPPRVISEPELGNSKHDGSSSSTDRGSIRETTISGGYIQSKPKKKIKIEQLEGTSAKRRGTSAGASTELGNSDTGRKLQQERCEQELRGWNRNTSEASDQWETEPQMGRDSHGAADWLDYAQLCETVDNRTDELRLLGNGVVPATAAKAWIVLLDRLNEYT